MKLKKFEKVFCVAAIAVGIAAAVVWMTGVSVSASLRDEADLPNLRGTEAVEHLKQQGLYSSLDDAMKNAGMNEGKAADLLVDPQVRVSPSNGVAYDHFGYSVAVSGSTAVIGAPRLFSQSEPGKAYIFVRGASGWTLQQTLTGETSGRDGFGTSVQIKGDTIIVGAPWETPRAANFWRGAVYVFARSGITWTQQTVLTAVNTGADGRFGGVTAFDGNTVVVAASRFPIAVSSVYVFVRNGASWSEQQQLSVTGPGSSLEFGASVGVSGNIIVVGDPLGRGSVKIWVRTGTSWNQQNGLAAPTSDQILRYGNEVALSGNTLVVKAKNDPSQYQPSSVYIYTTSNGGESWGYQERISPPDMEGFEEYFGDGLALEGDTLIVGDPQEGINTPSGKGYAVEFRRRGTSWSRERVITASDGAFADAFGRSVAVGNGTVLVGAWYDDVGANENQGSAYFFDCRRNGNQQVIANDGEAGDWFGYALAVSGNTAVVGAKQEEAPGGSPSQGAAYIFTLSGGGWTLQQKIKSNPSLGSAEFGHSIDIDGDTIAVGAWKETQPSGGDTQGAAYVFIRSGTTWTQQAKLLSSDGTFDDRFGNAIAISGNTVVVGAFGDDIGANNNQGSAYVFARSGSAWTQQAKLTASDGAAFEEFANSLDISGNTAVVGAKWNVYPEFKGAAYVFVRDGANWTQQQKLVAGDGSAGDEFGFAVSIDGDTAVIGAWRDDGEMFEELGSVYIFTRVGSVWTQRAKLFPNGQQPPFARFGSALSLDNGNLIVGQRGGQNRSFVFAGAGATWEQTEEIVQNGAGVFQFGESVGISGETAVVGAFGSTIGGNTTRGAAWVYYADCSSAPTGTAGAPINRRRCKPPFPATLGTVSDAQQPAGALTVTAQSVPQDITLTNLANNNGTITGIVGAGCAFVQTGPQAIVLRVSDSSLGVSTFKVTVNVIEQKPADFDGDGKSDVAVWRPSDKNWYILQSSNNAFTVVNFGLTTDRIAPGDYDGDGRTDIGLFRPTGTWFWLNSSNGSFSATQWGTNGDIPASGDYDGDGKFDASVFRPSNGTWYVFRSSDAGFTILNFGLSGDRPVPGDYDGDGRTDFAVFRPSSNVWYVLQSTAGFTALQFGAAGDKPTQGDYDGDAKTDFAVYRPSAGVWYLAQSILGQTSAQWGVAEDVPTPGDFDGDGKVDLAVFRPSQGFWYVKNSSGGGFVTAHGLSGDVPVEAGYIPQ